MKKVAKKITKTVRITTQDGLRVKICKGENVHSFSTRRIGGAYFRDVFTHEVYDGEPALIRTQRRKLPRKKFALVSLVCLMFVGIWSTQWISDYSYLLRASLVGLQAVEFTGTVSPIEKVPNWVALTNSERKTTYNQLPASKLIPLPDYNPSTFRAGQTWSPDNETERNAYITFPVPNLGNYTLDGTENSGSHPGVDIKTLIGTPVRAIANGVVIKVQEDPNGYGKHIAVAHVDFPDPSDPTKKTTLVSGYAHLSEMLVKMGEEVKKGQIIGKVGDTGMATTPHLHFQIDRADAPFHPYWPFTWSDVQSAGYSSYFDGVKYGIGKAKARQYTVNPFPYIATAQEYRDTQLVVSADTEALSEQIANETQENDQPEEIASTQENTSGQTEKSSTEGDSQEQKETTTSKIYSHDTNGEVVGFENKRSFVPGEETVVQVYINDENLIVSNGIDLTSTLRHLAKVTPSKLTTGDFSDGVAEVKVKTDSNSTFKIVATGDFGEVRSLSLRASLFTDVDYSDTHGEAIAYLKENNIVGGYPDGSFKPGGTLNRAEAVKILLVGNKIQAQVRNNSFPDVPADSWFLPYVTTAASRGIVKGYTDGEFKPGNTISRAEFLKVAIKTAGFDPVPPTENPYSDVEKDQWFAPYVAFSKEQDLIDLKQGGYWVPSQPITRGEAATVIYKLSKIK